jgi:hypothetical protein
LIGKARSDNLLVVLRRRIGCVSAGTHVGDVAADHILKLDSVKFFDLAIQQNDPPVPVGDADSHRDVIDDALQDRLIFAQPVFALFQLVDLRKDRDDAAFSRRPVAEAIPMAVDETLE